jgi:adenylate cyclase class 2
MFATTPLEIEVKLQLDGVEQLSSAGIALEIETERHFEDNWLMDTADRNLCSREAILRVRSAAGKGTITFKEKAGAGERESQFKKRIEIETAIADPQNALAILERLGYRKWFRYQKYRTVYRAALPSGWTLHVMLDETPIGNFIELEGEEEAIAQAVEMLGVSPSDYILESYLVLQADRCAELGRPLEDMVFDEKR